VPTTLNRSATNCLEHVPLTPSTTFQCSQEDGDANNKQTENRQIYLHVSLHA